MFNGIGCWVVALIDNQKDVHTLTFYNLLHIEFEQMNVDVVVVAIFNIFSIDFTLSY